MKRKTLKQGITSVEILTLMFPGDTTLPIIASTAITNLTDVTNHCVTNP